MRRFLCFISIFTAALVAPQAATATTPARGATPLVVRFFAAGAIPSLAYQTGATGALQALPLSPNSLSGPLSSARGQLVLRLAANQDPALAKWALPILLPENVSEAAVFLEAGAGSAEPVRVAHVVDISGDALPVGSVRIVNRLPVELYYAFNKDVGRLGPRAIATVKPSLDENQACALRVACADPRGGKPLQIKRGSLWLEEGQRALAIALLMRSPVAFDESGIATEYSPPMPGWLVFSL